MASTKGRACLGKTPFECRHTAVIAMNRYSKRYGAALGAMEVYKCKYCNNFHFGHKKRRKARR